MKGSLHCLSLPFLLLHVSVERVASVLIARYILDLHSVYIPDQSDPFSSIGIDTAFLGIIAAPLGVNSTWVTAPGDDIGRENNHGSVE